MTAARLLAAVALILQLGVGEAHGQARYLVGEPADADVRPRGPALVLMGGGRDVDAAFRWWRPYVAGGDVVVLRASGGDAYNAYLMALGGVDSVETLVITARDQANAPGTARALRRAEAIFLAGGDQARYLALWRGTAVERELRAAWQRRAVIGGTSAGLALLGEHAFGATRGTVRSTDALRDPFARRVLLTRGLLASPLLDNIITDSHFTVRRRQGRLAVFLARLATAAPARDRPLGIGVDEGTALVVGPDGLGAVLGQGAVTLLRLRGAPDCASGRPLVADLELTRLRAGHTLRLPAGEHSLPVERWRASDGALRPVRD